MLTLKQKKSAFSSIMTLNLGTVPQKYLGNPGANAIMTPQCRPDN